MIPVRNEELGRKGEGVKCSFVHPSAIIDKVGNRIIWLIQRSPDFIPSSNPNYNAPVIQIRPRISSTTPPPRPPQPFRQHLPKWFSRNGVSRKCCIKRRRWLMKENLEPMYGVEVCNIEDIPEFAHLEATPHLAFK